MNNIIKVENGNIALQEEVEATLRAFEIKKREMELLEKEVKTALLKAMEENNIKSYESPNVKITYKAPTTRKSVDTAALKEQGLYDAFVKETQVKSSVVITWK